MVTFFRKKMGINEVAGNLVQFALDQNDINSSIDGNTFPIQIDRRKLSFEMMFLRAFAVDFAIYIALDDKEHEAKLISDKFKDIIIKIMVESAKDTQYDAIKLTFERFDYYMEDVTNLITVAETPGYIDTLSKKIGKSFADICRYNKSVKVYHFGRKIFKTCIGGVMAFMKTIKINT